MLFSDRDSCRYANAPLREVICQLRFPAILSIGSNEPADFQEAIRQEFPIYAAKQEVAPPRLVGVGAPNARLETPPAITNYNFISADNLWKINLTKDFIALSTLRYTSWREFAAQLDKPLAAFIRIYRPAFFERIGLRYVNILSRQKLGLEGTPWRDLLQPAYLSVLDEEDVDERMVGKCALDLELRPDSSCLAKIHAGPGMVKAKQPGAPADQETKFILDLDLSMGGKIAPNLAPGAMETLHGHCTRLFEGAITDVLRQALAPLD